MIPFSDAELDRLDRLLEKRQHAADFNHHHPEWSHPMPLDRPINANDIQALQYVKNTNGGAEPKHFIEDHEPVGALLWMDLFQRTRWITVNEAGKIVLSPDGEATLAAGVPK